MPQRFLKPGIRTSRRLAECSRPARLLYVYLITLVDDWGRYDGDPVLLKSECFPYDDDVRLPDFEAWLESLIEAETLLHYQVDGKWYIQILRWTERTRGKSSKFPDPRSNAQRSAAERSRDASASMALARAHGAGAGGEALSRDGSADWSVVSQQLPETHRTDAVRNAWREWVKYRKQLRKSLTQASVTRQVNLLGEMSTVDCVKSIEASITAGWTGLFKPKDGAKPDGNGARITGKRIRRKPA